MPRLSVILPTYNEAENILLLLDALREALQGVDAEFIVVDDDSPDGTWRLCEDYAKDKPEVRVIRRTENPGLTPSFNDGIAAAKGDLVAWMDCDFSHPPELLPALMSVVDRGEADAAIASRFVPGARDERQVNHGVQKFLSWVLAMSSYALRLPIRDITSGYIVVRKKALDAIGPLQGDHGEYFIDMASKLAKKGATMKELPYVCKDRQRGESKTATSVWGYVPKGVNYLRMLMRHFFG